MDMRNISTKDFLFGIVSFLLALLSGILITPMCFVVVLLAFPFIVVLVTTLASAASLEISRLKNRIES